METQAVGTRFQEFKRMEVQFDPARYRIVRLFLTILAPLVNALVFCANNLVIAPLNRIVYGPLLPLEPKTTFDPPRPPSPVEAAQERPASEESEVEDEPEGVPPAPKPTEMDGSMVIVQRPADGAFSVWWNWFSRGLPVES